MAVFNKVNRYTYCVHVLGEQQVGEAEISVQYLVRVEVEQAFYHLSKDTPSCKHAITFITKQTAFI